MPVVIQRAPGRVRSRRFIPSFPPVLEQSTFRFGEDVNAEDDPVWMAGENVSVRWYEDTSFRVRIQVNVTGNLAETQFLLEADENEADTWDAMTVDIDTFDSLVIAANGATATTPQMTEPSGKSMITDFTAGRISDDVQLLPAIDIVANGYTELEWNLQSGVPATYRFRVTRNGVPFNTYTQMPSIVIGQHIAIVADARRRFTNNVLAVR